MVSSLIITHTHTHGYTLSLFTVGLMGMCFGTLSKNDSSSLNIHQLPVALRLHVQDCETFLIHDRMSADAIIVAFIFR